MTRDAGPLLATVLEKCLKYPNSLQLKYFGLVLFYSLLERREHSGETSDVAPEKPEGT